MRILDQESLRRLIHHLLEVHGEVGLRQDVVLVGEPWRQTQQVRALTGSLLRVDGGCGGVSKRVPEVHWRLSRSHGVSPSRGQLLLLHLQALVLL